MITYTSFHLKMFFIFIVLEKDNCVAKSKQKPKEITPPPKKKLFPTQNASRGTALN